MNVSFDKHLSKKKSKLKAIKVKKQIKIDVLEKRLIGKYF